MRILLTGGSGFIGRNIIQSPLSQRHSILAPGHAELDCSNADSVDAFFRKNEVDCVVHAATKPGHRNAKDPTNLFYTNTRMFFALARHAAEFRKIIVLGSGAVYDMRACRPRAQEDDWVLHLPSDEHGFCKYVCASVVEASSNIYDLRLFGVFGPYEDYAIRFVSNMICKMLFDLPLTIKQNRVFSYLWIDDLVPVLESFLQTDPLHHSYNITPDDRWELLDLARLVLEISGKKLPIVVASPRMGHEYTGDNGRLRSEYTPKFTPMRTAIEALIRWYSDRREELDMKCLLRDK